LLTLECFAEVKDYEDTQAGLNTCNCRCLE
jgi:hypothetical protein